MARVHTVKQGECLQSVAERYGFLPDTIWNHPDNAALVESRTHGSVLAPGDILHVPDRVAKQVSVPIDRRSVFRRRAVPSIIRIRLVEEGLEQGFAGLSWRVELRGNPALTGVVGDDGTVAAYVPCAVKSATLIIDPEGEHERRIVLRLGALAPVDTREGVRARLQNLDYLDTPDATDPRVDEDGPEARRAIRAALRMFQCDHDLDASGKLDDPTRRALLDAHGY